MKVYFSVWFPSLLGRRNEFELAEPGASQLETLRAMRWFEGAVLIADREGAEVEITGALEAWVQNLCFEAVTNVVAGAPTCIMNFTGPDSLLVEPAGKSVRLSGEQVDPVLLPIAELAPALVACGVRFLRWARAIKAEDSSYLENLDYIETFVGPAQAALRAGGLAAVPTP